MPAQKPRTHQTSNPAGFEDRKIKSERVTDEVHGVAWHTPPEISLANGECHGSRKWRHSLTLVMAYAQEASDVASAESFAWHCKMN